MKQRQQPHVEKAGNYLEQGLMDGLTEEGKKYCREQIKKFQAFSVAIPYGIIRKVALEKYKK